MFIMLITISDYASAFTTFVDLLMFKSWYVSHFIKFSSGCIKQSIKHTEKSYTKTKLESK